MKIKIDRVGVLLTAFVLLCLSGAEGQEPITKLKVVTEMANVRLKPDIGSVIIHQVPEGKILESTAKEGEWYLIKIQVEEGQEASGYVHESTVIVIERPPQIPVKKPVVKEEPPEPEKKVEEKKEEVTEEEKKEEEQKEEEPQIPLIPELEPERPPYESHLELWLTGGGSYSIGGDLNSGTQGFVDYYRDYHLIDETFDTRPVHLSYILGGEFSIPLGSNFFMGFGLDYFRGERKSLIELQDSPMIQIQTHPRIEAIPVRLTISYYPFRSVYIKTGIEYYFARCEYYYRYEDNTYWKEWHGTAKTQNSGILGAIGIDLEVAPWLSVVVEATGRYAKISGFKGSDTSIDSDDSEYTEEGTLYHYYTRGTVEESIPLLYIRLRSPTEDALIHDPRRAIIDFSGVSLKAGVRLRF